MRANIIGLVLLLFGVVSGYQKCCDGDQNVIHKKKCVGGENITGITCDKRYILKPEGDDKLDIDENGTLFDNSIAIPNDLYCIAKEFETGDEFAIACFTEQTQPKESTAIFVCKATCAILSVLFLILTIIVYIIVPDLRDLQGKCILHSISALAIAMFFLSIMQFGVSLSTILCHGIGYITYASFLATFTWLNALSFQIWRSTVAPSMLGTDNQWYLIYCIYGYGLPFIMVISSIIAHHAPGTHIKPGIGQYSCWFTGRNAVWAYFYGPVAFFLIINVVLFCWTIKKLWSDKDVENNTCRVKSLKYKCLLYVKLFFIMGLSWIFEVLSFAFDDQDHSIRYIWMITDLINALQGVLIFLILVVFRKRAIRGLARRGLGCIPLPSQWRTLQDEECEEVVEENKLNDEDSFKPKDNQIRV